MYFYLFLFIASIIYFSKFNITQFDAIGFDLKNYKT